MKVVQSLRFILSLGFLFVAQASFAAPICVSNAADYNAKKSQLPAVFQNLPLVLTVDNMIVTAGLKIRISGSKLKLEGSVWKPSEIYSDDAYIKQVCYQGSSVKVTLENGKSYNAQVTGNGVSISGASFTKSTDAKFAGIIEKIKAAQGSTTRTAGARGNQ